MQRNIYIHFFSCVSHHAEIRCPEPVLAEHGILSVTGNDRMYGRTLIRTGTVENSNTGATSYKIGALAKYRCERGYKVVGEPLSTCEENGKWSGEVPQCVCKYPSDSQSGRQMECILTSAIIVDRRKNVVPLIRWALPIPAKEFIFFLLEGGARSLR